MRTPGPVGWFGKLPTLGDFASRRLPPDFVEAWDDWLSTGLAQWQAEAPGQWLEAYLGGPSWRFVLMPGVMPGLLPGVSPGTCGRTAWAGVLMPSVDRVGRYFPFTLAEPLPSLPADGAQTGALLAWMRRLDDLALDALQDDWSVDQLEDALVREQHAAATGCDIAPGGPLADLADKARDPRLSGHSLWLSADAGGQPRLRTCAGLPQGADFRDLLSGISPDRADTVDPNCRNTHAQ